MNSLGGADAAEPLGFCGGKIVWPGLSGSPNPLLMGVASPRPTGDGRGYPAAGQTDGSVDARAGQCQVVGFDRSLANAPSGNVDIRCGVTNLRPDRSIRGPIMAISTAFSTELMHIVIHRP